MEIADSGPECGGRYNLRARKRKYFENDSDSSPIQCGQRNTKSSSEGHYRSTQIKLTCLSISYMTFVKSTHLMIKMWTYLYMFMIYMYVLNIGTITFYYIANLTCIAPFLNGGAIWNSYPFIASTGSPFFKHFFLNSKDYQGLKNLFFTISKTGISRSRFRNPIFHFRNFR